MKRLLLGLALLAVALGANRTWSTAGEKDDKDKGWVQIFNGKDIFNGSKVDGWKVYKDEPGDWSVKDGILVGKGPKRSHLYSERGDFENFHYRIEAKISDKGNSGQYFRTQFPDKARYPAGYEAQINSTHTDPVRTGSLYGFVKVTDMLVKPDTWFTQEVIADGNHIIILVNGKKVVDYVDEKNTYKKGHFAIQQHEPPAGVKESIIMIKKIEVKELPAK